MKCSTLTPKQARFVEEYSLDHNGAAAAVRSGYSPKSARVAASKLVAKGNIREAIAQREAEAAMVLNVTREGILAALLEAHNDARKQKNPGVMVLALKQIILVCGFQRHVVTVASTPAAAARTAGLNAMSDEELLALTLEPAVAD
jgi:hypothetical protein